MAAGLGLSAPVLAAQGTAAVVRGTVRDNAGATLAGVRVTARSARLTGPRAATTPDDGTYLLAALPPGDYVISYERSDLVTVLRTMTLDAGQVVSIDAALSPAREGYDALTVEIDGDRAERRPATASLTRDVLERLPLGGEVAGAIRLIASPASQRPAGAWLDTGAGRWRYTEPLALLPRRDAFDAVTVVSAGLAPDIAGAPGGVVIAAARSGGDLLAGSARATIGQAPFAADTPAAAPDVAGLAAGGEYAVGGPIAAGRAWYFASAAHGRQTVDDRVALTGDPFETSERRRALAARLTTRPTGGAELRADVQHTGSGADRGRPFGTARVLDLDALGDTSRSSWIGSARVAATAGDRLTWTARYSEEAWSLQRDETPGGEPADRTAVIDAASGAWWSAPPCAGCGDDTARERSWQIAAGVLRAGASGTHYVRAGYDGSHDRRTPGSPPAGGLLHVIASEAAIDAGRARPVLRPDGSAWIAWRADTATGLRLLRHGVFAGDRWQPTPSLSVDAGLRLDWFNLRTEAGLADRVERTVSPRLMLAWTPAGDSAWVVSGGVDRTADALSSVAASGVPLAGGPGAVGLFAYGGPPVNDGGTEFDAQAAAGRALDWFFANGGTGRAPDLVLPSSLVPPDDVSLVATATTWTIGAHRTLGMATWVRADLFRVSTSGWAGARLDRRDTGVAVQARYRLGTRANFGGSYAVSDGDETRDSVLLLPLPAVDDARHRLSGWAWFGVMEDEEDVGALDLTLLHTIDSGRPVVRAGTPGGADVAFVADPTWRTDLALSWWKRLPGTVYGRMFVQVHLLNLAGTVNPIDPAAGAVGALWRDRAAAGAMTMPRTFRLSMGVKF